MRKLAFSFCPEAGHAAPRCMYPHALHQHDEKCGSRGESSKISSHALNVPNLCNAGAPRATRISKSIRSKRTPFAHQVRPPTRSYLRCHASKRAPPVCPRDGKEACLLPLSGTRGCLQTIQGSMCRRCRHGLPDAQPGPNRYHSRLLFDARTFAAPGGAARPRAQKLACAREQFGGR
jgi:hypothetical protein